MNLFDCWGQCLAAPPEVRSAITPLYNGVEIPVHTRSFKRWDRFGGDLSFNECMAAAPQPYTFAGDNYPLSLAGMFGWANTMGWQVCLTLDTSCNDAGYHRCNNPAEWSPATAPLILPGHFANAVTIAEHLARWCNNSAPGTVKHCLCENEPGYRMFNLEQYIEWARALKEVVRRETTWKFGVGDANRQGGSIGLDCARVVNPDWLEFHRVVDDSTPTPELAAWIDQHTRYLKTQGDWDIWLGEWGTGGGPNRYSSYTQEGADRDLACINAAFNAGCATVVRYANGGVMNAPWWGEYEMCVWEPRRKWARPTWHALVEIGKRIGLHQGLPDPWENGGDPPEQIGQLYAARVLSRHYYLVRDGATSREIADDEQFLRFYRKWMRKVGLLD